MLRVCLHENSNRTKMSIKLISLVWRYHNAILKLWHSNSIVMSFLYFYYWSSMVVVTIKLLTSTVINFRILWKPNIAFCVWKTTCCKSWKTSLYEFWKVGILESRAYYVIFSKIQLDFWGGILQQKKLNFSFYGCFIFNIFQNKFWRKKL